MRREAAAAAWALAATLYWCGFAILFFVTSSLWILVPGWIGFVLLSWAIRQEAVGRPTASDWVTGTGSLLYTAAACFAFGISAYVESHGCAVAPDSCADHGLGLAWTVLIAAIVIYFTAAWVVNRTRARLAGAAGRGQEGTQ